MSYNFLNETNPVNKQYFVRAHALPPTTAYTSQAVQGAVQLKLEYNYEWYGMRILVVRNRSYFLSLPHYSL